jgi:hypothetical protein
MLEHAATFLAVALVMIPLNVFGERGELGRLRQLGPPFWTGIFTGSSRLARFIQPQQFVDR